MIAGIFNSFFMGTLLDKYQCYRKALNIICICSTITLAMSAYGFPSGSVLVECGIIMLTGASLIPIVTVCFSFAAEITYPVPETFSIGVMICSAQIFGFLLVILIMLNFDRDWFFQLFVRFIHYGEFLSGYSVHWQPHSFHFSSSVRFDLINNHILRGVEET
jgi:hypothetical protein